MPNVESERPQAAYFNVGYIVLFTGTPQVGEYQPIVAGGPGSGNVFNPSGLDPEVEPVLPALWFGMQLPRDLGDLVSLPADAPRASRYKTRPPNIQLIPAWAATEAVVRRALMGARPGAIFAPDREIELASRLSVDMGFVIPPLAISDLDQDTFAGCWRRLQATLATGDNLGAAPVLQPPGDFSTIASLVHLRSQLGMEQAPLPAHTPDDILPAAYQLHAMQRVFAALDDNEDPSREEVVESIYRHRETLRLPTAILLPGQAPKYLRQVDELAGVPMRDTDAAGVGRHFLLNHEAITMDSVAYEAPAASPLLFQELNAIERYWTEVPRAVKTRRMLSRLDRAAGYLWGSGLNAAVGRASFLSVFSEFPVGLLTFPGDTSPLAFRIPIEYRPLTPLTLALQNQMTVAGLDLSENLKALVVECIPDSDPVGQLSRLTWQTLLEQHRLNSPLDLEYVEVKSAAEFRRVVAAAEPSILVISAHGSVLGSGKLPCIVIGDEPVLGPELGELPPFVVLSACRVTPRGEGSVTPAGLLLRQGARAVLGAQVPVDVRHNAVLMVRFFLYIGEIAAGREPGHTILDAWHRTQILNPINDIARANIELESWIFKRVDGSSPLERFTAKGNGARLRRGRVYEDSEKALVRIADDIGDGPKVRAWLAGGYAPETMFYTMLGRASGLYLRARSVESYAD